MANNWPKDEELEAAGWIKRSRRDRRILSAPRPRQYYWVDFPRDAYAPEFVGEHPGVVVRGGTALHSTCIVVPVTSKPQAEARYVHKLSENPNPAGKRDGIEAFAVCDHLYTVNVCRLRPILSLKGGPIYPRVLEEDFEAIKGLVTKALFPPGPANPQPTAKYEEEKPAETEPKAMGNRRKILTLPK